MKLIVAGSRHFRNITRYDLETFMFRFDIGHLVKEIVSGGCPTGPDNAAFWHAKHNNIKFKEFPAEWNKYGRKAGPLRNKKMAIYGDILLLIWDGESPGSANMKKEMLALNKTIHEVILKDYNENV